MVLVITHPITELSYELDRELSLLTRLIKWLGRGKRSNVLQPRGYVGKELFSQLSHKTLKSCECFYNRQICLRVRLSITQDVSKRRHLATTWSSHQKTNLLISLTPGECEIYLNCLPLLAKVERKLSCLVRGRRESKLKNSSCCHREQAR